MAQFVFALLFLIFGVPIAVTVAMKVQKARLYAAGGGAVLLILGVVLLFSSLLTQVGTKEVGVVTSFGKPTGYLSNGLHFKAPWAKVTELDAAIQTDTYVKAQESGTEDCITVRIAHQATGCADASIRWQIKETAAPSLFQQYRDFENIRRSLVTRELTSSMNDATGAYDPLAVDANGNSSTITTTQIQQAVLKQMQTEIGSQVDVKSVIVSIIHLDSDTQAKVNTLQQQIAATRVAQQQIATNTAQAEANKVLAASISNDPNILVSKCLDILAKAPTIPAGFSCFPNSSSNVLVDGTGK